MLNRSLLLWAALMLVTVAGAAGAEAPGPAPRLVADIRPLARLPAGGAPRELTAGRSLLFLAAEDPFAGVELWATNGTPGKAYRVADLCPGPCGSSPRRITAAGNLVYFLARDPAHGEELWRSDGTPAGTFLLADLQPGPASGGPAVSEVVTSGSRAFFVVGRSPRPGGRRELWTSDGTSRGTRRLTELASLSLLAPVRDLMLFVGFDAAHGHELWRSDGTPTGTRLLRDIAPGPASGLVDGELNAEVLGGRLYVPGFDAAHGQELWRSDGTAAGTRLVRDLVPGPRSSSPLHLRAAGSTLYFVAEAAAGRSVWRSDGTGPGTRRVSGQPGPPWVARPLFALGGALLFLEETVGQGELWITGAAGTHRLLSGFAWIASFASLGESAVFVVGRFEVEIWRTDGTPQGTAPLFEIEATLAYDLVAFRGFAYFSRFTIPAVGDELWRTDGTPAGTGLFADFHSGDRSSSPQQLTALDDVLVFTADDGEHGPEPWASDGTAEATALVGDLSPPPPAGRPPHRLARLADRLLVATVRDPVGDGALWATAGVPGDAVLLRDGIGFAHGGHILGATALFFVSREQGRQWVIELWRSDGTAAGTAPLAEVDRGLLRLPGLPEPTVQEAVTAGGHLYFVSFGALWRSDGTAAGTAPIAGVCDVRCEGIHDLTAVGDTLYFGLLDGTPEIVRDSLWRSDGTPEGTQALRVLLEVSFEDWLARAGRSPITQLTPAGDRLYFAGEGRTHGSELWVSDGTAAGTRMVRDLRPGPAGSHPVRLTARGDGVFFAADGGVRGQELWWSDGTRQGTRPLRDIAPGPASSYPQELAVIDGTLIFAAFDPEHGLEMWRSDGTAAGTVLLADILPGRRSSAPRSFTLAGDDLYFVAGQPRLGYELWAIDRRAAVP